MEAHIVARLQVLNPELQRRKMARAHQKRLHTAMFKRLAHSASPFGVLMVDGKLDTGVADQLFDQFDENKSGTIDAGAPHVFGLGSNLPVSVFTSLVGPAEGTSTAETGPATALGVRILDSFKF